ncbi:MAG TPA: hypothetical protein VK766_10465 [Cytophagaceae bacterium]|jgi:hypothetical protein|nr:hypothetical protein [Cytophagaceae bacterium]
MKNSRFIIYLLGINGLLLSAFYYVDKSPKPKDKKIATTTKAKGCVFKTVMGEDSLDPNFYKYQSSEKVLASLQHGLQWVASAQQSDGGWGAGSHSNQQEMNPHAVKTDPATTSMVAMALLRTGNTLTSGPQSSRLNKALQYLLVAVETAPKGSSNITKETGTQIQIKLGANIDVILTAQFLSNVMDYLDHDAKLKARIARGLNTCVEKIQHAQDTDGSIKGSGWAGVLQSSFANNALESAQSKGIKVDSVILEKSRDYQKGNYNTSTGDVKTEKGAGVILYSVSGSTRASAKEARKVEEEIRKAKHEGKLNNEDAVNAQSLEKLGYSKTDALKYSTSYNVYQAGKQVAQSNEVLTGFGNNGGEEFLSFLQTGESLIIGKDSSWKKWYSTTSGSLLAIQNEDGSWNGHHCITSPAFCTATCLLILSVNNDVEKLVEMGAK